MYERSLDFMDKSIFVRGFFHAQNKNPKEEVSTSVFAEKLENQEIIDFVVGEMKDTLGNKGDT